MTRPLLVPRLAEFGDTIFAEMSALAARTGAVNLGQGFPDTDGPEEVKQAAAEALRGGYNQYPPLPGHAELRHAISEHQERFWGLSYDPDTEVLVTAGATEAIAAAMLSLCDRGDEVITFEPYYDSYAASIALSGATRRVVTLRPDDGIWRFDADELRAAVGPSTRLILLNTPHNPTGKVFTREELTVIAELACEHDLLVVADEVYEHLVFEGEHIPISSLPNMRERTIQISSGGKTFSFTGWKVGWACAPPEIIAAIRTSKQFLTFVNAGPFQPAIAVGLRLPDSYFDGLVEELRAKGDFVADRLEEVGFEVMRPQGTYFVTADIRPFGETDGRAFCLNLPERAGVVAVPTVVFYDNKEEGSHIIRFAFPKKQELLTEAMNRLQAGLQGPERERVER